MIRNRKQWKIIILLAAVFLTAAAFLCACSVRDLFPSDAPKEGSSAAQGQQTDNEPSPELPFDIPDYSSEASVTVHGDLPFFQKEEITAEIFAVYSPLDTLGRCGPAFAGLHVSALPKEERGKIGDIRPSGWQTVKYEGVDGNYLYNRCHLVAYCLNGDNANECNLITGTRYLNIIGMLPLELEVLDYVVKSRQHILYRATPVFAGEELVARGVLIEAMSVEDGGEGYSICRFCYNVQPGIEIDYTTGESCQKEVIYMPGVEKKN